MLGCLSALCTEDGVQVEVSVQRVPPKMLAVIRAEIPYAEISVRSRPLYDRIYQRDHRGELTLGGHNVILYRDERPGTWDTKVGVQVASPFSDLGEIVCSETPAGEVATCTHLGPSHELGSAHDAVIAWCDRAGHRRSGLRWEVHGDWTEDEAKLQTDVFYLLEPEGCRAQPCVGLGG